MTLLILNRGTPDTAVNTEPTVQQEPVAPTPASTASAKPCPGNSRQETRGVKKEIPPNFTAITSKSLQPYMSHLTDTYFKPRGKVTRTVVTDSPTETLAQWCRDLAPPKTEQPGAGYRTGCPTHDTLRLRYLRPQCWRHQRDGSGISGARSGTQQALWHFQFDVRGAVHGARRGGSGSGPA